MSPGWSPVLQANDINDRGHITGRAFFDGGVRGVLLLPAN
jgi:hypothetical protein